MKNKYILEIAVFVSGAVVMVFELVGSRVVAPYLGTSIVIWTSLIGIILGSLSLGYYSGGIIADKNLSYKIFSLLFFLGAIFIALNGIFHTNVLMLGVDIFKDIRWQGLFVMLVLFAPASLFLGMISPYAVKLKLNDLTASGRTVGNLYALSTLGSIVGTFAAGFFLIPFFGTATLLFILSLALLAISILIAWRDLFVPRMIFLALVIFLTAVNYIKYAQGVNAKTVDIDTLYNRIFVYDAVYPEDNRPFRMLRWDNSSIQGGVYLDKKKEDKAGTVLKILKYFRLANFFEPQIKNALLLGGGTYSFPPYFLTWEPEARMDVVEIDPALLEIAQKKFGYQEDKRVHIYHEDARNFLNNNQKKYDAVFVDTFNANLSYPFHLSTKETAEKIYKSLTDSGVVAANFVSSLSAPGNEFLQAEIATYKEVFPFVELYAVKDPNNKDMVQNILMIAKKDNRQPNSANADAKTKEMLSHHISGGIPLNKGILTDDYAPVDYYALKMLKK